MNKWLDKEILIRIDTLLMMFIVLLNDFTDIFNRPKLIGWLFIFSFFFLLFRSWFIVIKHFLRRNISNSSELKGE